MSTRVEIHPLVTMEMLRACERLQLQVWGYDDLEVVPAAQMRAALHAGALVAGAFVGRELVGFAYGFPALPHEAGLVGPGLHSHMTAVVPEARGLGAGRRLKWYQRRWCVERGLDWVTWTFDPLQARNARLNLHHLGAVVAEYQVDFYGVLGGVLSGDLPTDRFVALWDLTGPHVRAAAARDPAAAAYLLAGDEAPRPSAVAPTAAVAWALRRDAGADDPQPPTLGLAADAVWTAVPRDVNALRREAPPRALAWAEALRAASLDLIARGYAVDAFVEGAYRWRPRSEINI
jgi:predicted GNAT superfamily acetyltransferase